MFSQSLKEEMFPELMESEDERIREALINGFNKLDKSAVWYNGITNGQILAWLEKQTNIIPNECVFRPLAGTDIKSAAKQAIEQQGVLAKEVVLAFNGAYIPVKGKSQDIIVNEYNSWIEKQGQVRCTGVWKKEATGVLKKMLDLEMEMITPEESLGMDSETYNKIVDECIYGDDQKPDDKAKPKFKVGDRVIGIVSGMQYFITKVCDDHYNTESGCIIMFCSQNNFELYKQKPAWSEEDELRLNTICSLLRGLPLQQDWLKSLKDRCCPQSQWKPSDRDIKLLRELSDGKICPDNYRTRLYEIINNLKFL